MNEQVKKTKKRTFYGVIAEFYDYGAVKTNIIERFCSEKPQNTMRQPYGMSAYIDWFETREQAEAFLAARTLKTRAA